MASNWLKNAVSLVYQECIMYVSRILKGIHMDRASEKEIGEFRKNPPALVIVDLGNSGLKAMLAGRPETEQFIRHEIVFPAAATYSRMAHRAELRPVEYVGAEFFKKLYRDKTERLVMIGDGVTSNARSNKLTGEAKYQIKYFDILLAAMLKRLLPDGHNDVWIALATPSDAIDYLEDIKPIVGGIHKVETLSGKSIKYKVTRLIFWEEPHGGMLRFMERNEKANNAILIREGERIIVIDIGGKISSMTVVGVGKRLEPSVLYNESPDPFNLGIIDVLENFARELKGLHPDEFKLFKTAGSIPSFMLEEGIQTGKITVSGELLDVNQARLNALSNILDEIEARYNNNMSGGAIASHIIVTGGGGGLLIPVLRTDILNHNSVHLADNIDSIQMANLRGGSAAMIEWLEAKGFIDG